ncbi:uncharacterized protein LOC114397121 [Glycine soja]|uniref:uncharacterized protein LOC114397121 n=1 Tax=Glycine soja TaxID=3848 RepID=UPI0010394082|nr:uncharacterized protein LOC114397121 [Glycine soja]
MSQISKSSKPSKKIESNNNTFTCFECGKQGHIKSKCLIYLRKQLAEKKGKKDKKQKKAYIAWEDNGSTSSDSSSEEDVANMCLMVDSMDDSSTIEETEVCLKVRDSLWYLNSGYARHMMGDKSKITDFVSKEGGYVTFGDNNKGRILGEETLEISTRHK